MNISEIEEQKKITRIKKKQGRSQKIKKIVVENTLYSLLVYFLLEKRWKSSVYILESNNLSKEFIRKIKKYSKVYLIKYSDNKLKNLTNYYYMRFFWNIFSYLNINNIFYGNDDLRTSSFFRRNKFYILEDGLVNYNYLNRTEKMSLKKMLKKY